MPGKRFQFDEETRNALDLLARDRIQEFLELADEEILRRATVQAAATHPELPRFAMGVRVC